MVPAHTTVELQQVGLLIVQVRTCHLRGVEPLTTTAEASATTASGEAHIVGVVGIRHQEYLQVVFHHAPEYTACITVFSTGCDIGIHHHTFVHTGLDTEVEHRLLLTIVDTADARQIALLIIGFDTIDNVCGQILDGSLRVASHEFLTVDEDFLDFLTVDLDRAIVADLCTRQTLDEFLYHRTLWRTEGICVIYKCVGFQSYFRSMGRHSSTFQHNGIGFQGNRTHRMILALRNRNLLRVVLKTNEGNLQGISSIARRLNREGALCVCYCICNEFLSAEKRCGSLNNSFFRVFLDNISRNCTLRECYHCRKCYDP